MAGLPQFSYPGTGESARDQFSFCQTVRVKDKLFISGQGGWDRATGVISKDLATEVEQTFKNVDFTLKHAGGKGWEQVYLVRTYSTNLKATEQLISDNYRKYMPNHHAVWTELSVPQLALADMTLEIEVEAYDPEGWKALVVAGQQQQQQQKQQQGKK